MVKFSMKRSRYIKTLNARSIDIIANSVQHWSATKETSILNSVQNNINKQSQKFAKLYNIKQSNQSADNDNIKAFDHEFWMEHLNFDAATVRMCYQGSADYLTDFDIHPEDIQHISTPLQPRTTQATTFDYEKVKANFCFAPLEAIKHTFK